VPLKQRLAPLVARQSAKQASRLPLARQRLVLCPRSSALKAATRLRVSAYRARGVFLVVGSVGSEIALCLTLCLGFETLRSVKEVVMEAHARTAIRSFSKSVKMELGKYIFQLQQGQIMTMPASRPMPTIALGASELRVKDRAGFIECFTT